MKLKLQRAELNMKEINMVEAYMDAMSELVIEEDTPHAEVLRLAQNASVFFLIKISY
jgi:hypothetical protein